MDDDLYPVPQHYSIYCPICGRAAARLIYDPPNALYMHYTGYGV